MNVTLKTALLSTAAACCFAVVGCAGGDDDIPTAPVADTAANAGRLAGMPTSVANQVEADLPAGAQVTGSRSVNAENGETIFIVTYIVDGDAEQAAYNRQGRRLDAFEPAATPSSSTPSGPIDQEPLSGDGVPSSGNADTDSRPTVNVLPPENADAGDPQRVRDTD